MFRSPRKVYPLLALLLLAHATLTAGQSKQRQAEVVGKQAHCQIKVYVFGLDLDDGTKGVGWLTDNMRTWWKGEGRTKRIQLCFTETLATADYRLEWKRSTRPYISAEGTRYRVEIIRATVYRPDSDVLLFTTEHIRRWVWSKPPDKDAFKEAIEFISDSAKKVKKADRPDSP